MIDFYPWVIIDDKCIFMIPHAYEEVWTSIDYLSSENINLHTNYSAYDKLYEYIYGKAIILTQEDRNKIGLTYIIPDEYKTELLSKRKDHIYDYDWYNKFTKIDTPLSMLIDKYFDCFIVFKDYRNKLSLPNLNICFHFDDEFTFELYFNDLKRLEAEIKKRYYV